MYDLPLSQIGSLTVCDDLNQCLGALVTGWVRAAQLLPLLIWKNDYIATAHQILYMCRIDWQRLACSLFCLLRGQGAWRPHLPVCTTAAG